MENDVKPPTIKRRYDSTRRKAAAAQTRQAIFDSARSLFLAGGYAATTMPAIAQASGVALDTVYAVAGTKPIIFRQLIERALSGGNEPVPALERDYVLEIQAEPDARRKLARYARALREIHGRLAPLFGVLRDAAGQDPELAALWMEIANRRARNMRLFVADIASAQELRSGVDISEAADIIWATNGPEFYLLLVGERGWLPERYERWLADIWIRTLLP